MPTLTSSTESPAALRERLAELIEKHQRLIVHGDVVSRADCCEEIEKIQAQLRGVKPAAKADDGFFGRGEKRRTAPADPHIETRALVAQAKAKGAIIPAAAPMPALDVEGFRSEIDRLRAEGKIRGPLDPVKITKNGRDATLEGKLRVQWMDVTPALAREWLQNNFRNRPISEDVVAAYARDMVLGQWVATHQGIAFNDRDELIDGQHRLLAIIKAGVTLRLMVTFGLPAVIEGREMTTMDAVDRGRTRSVADQLKIQHGFKDGAITAAVCATLGTVCFGERTRRLSVGQTLEIFRAFEEPLQWVIAHRAKAHGLRSAGVLAAFAFALAADPDFADGGHDRSAIARMYEALIEGAGAEDSPIRRLHAFLTSDDAKLLSRGHDRSLVHVALHAIDLEQRGERIAQLDPPVDGAGPFRERQRERVEKIAGLFRLPA